MSSSDEDEDPPAACCFEDWPAQEACFDNARWLKGLKTDIDTATANLNAFIMMEDSDEEHDPFGDHADAAQAVVDWLAVVASGLDDLFFSLWGYEAVNVNDADGEDELAVQAAGWLRESVEQSNRLRELIDWLWTHYEHGFADDDALQEAKAAYDPIYGFFAELTASTGKIY